MKEVRGESKSPGYRKRTASHFSSAMVLVSRNRYCWIELKIHSTQSKPWRHFTGHVLSSQKFSENDRTSSDRKSRQRDECEDGSPSVWHARCGSSREHIIVNSNGTDQNEQETSSRELLRARYQISYVRSQFLGGWKRSCRGDSLCRHRCRWQTSPLFSRKQHHSCAASVPTSTLVRGAATI